MKLWIHDLQKQGDMLYIPFGEDERIFIAGTNEKGNFEIAHGVEKDSYPVIYETPKHYPNQTLGYIVAMEVSSDGVIDAYYDKQDLAKLELLASGTAILENSGGEVHLKYIYLLAIHLGKEDCLNNQEVCMFTKEEDRWFKISFAVSGDVKKERIEELEQNLIPRLWRLRYISFELMNAEFEKVCGIED